MTMILMVASGYVHVQVYSYYCSIPRLLSQDSYLYCYRSFTSTSEKEARIRQIRLDCTFTLMRLVSNRPLQSSDQIQPRTTCCST